jgi:hypothetical protein
MPPKKIKEEMTEISQTSDLPVKIKAEPTQTPTQADLDSAIKALQKTKIPILSIPAKEYTGWISTVFRELQLAQVLDQQRNVLPSFADIVGAFLASCPKTYEEAMNGPDASHWKKATDREMASIKAAETYVVIRPHKSQLKKRPVKNRWVFAKKYDKHQNVIKYKARLVAKEFTQKKGIDNLETFSPVAKFKSIRLLPALCAKLNLDAFQDDAPTAFLKENLKEEIWMEQLEGYETGNPNVDKCLLLKTLYGLKQSPREWNIVIHNYLISKGFMQSTADPCICWCLC